MGDTSVLEDSEENKMEITRNPFDSNLYDKDNYPGLDASVFLQSTTPEKHSNKEFRWSIDQIALMKPAELDLYPNQEYSISYEKKEDELRDQEEVNEYFQNVLLPSPWLEEGNEILKRVTFSPHPPIMRYIQDPNNHSGSSDSSNSPSVKDYVEERKGVSQKETMMSDACCQTRITLPPNFDLESLLDQQFTNYNDESGEAKELMVSTLRRKLFGHEVSTSSLSDNYISPTVSQRTSCVTSSPRKSNVSSSDVSSIKSIFDSPSVSPVKRISSGSSISVFSSSTDFSPKHTSNITTPHFVRNIEMSLSSVDVSPIGSLVKKKHVNRDNYSFMPEVSFDIDESDGVRESSRAIGFGSPDVSPILQNVHKKSNSMFAPSAVMDSMEIPEAAVQSIKESTARNIHAFSGIDISSINGNGSHGKDSADKHDIDSALDTQTSGGKQKKCEDEKENLQDIVEDDGPLDITELTRNEEDCNEENENYHSSNNGSLNKTELTETNSAGVQNTNNFISTKKTISSSEMKIENVWHNNKDRETISSNTNINPKTVDQHHSPLKGILKHRDSLTPTRPILENSTQYNTICNSGKKRPIPKLLADVGNNVDKCNNLAKPSLINRSLNEEFNVYQDVGFDLKWVKDVDRLTEHDELLCIRASSVLRRATSMVKRCDRENCEKENIPPSDNSRERPLSIQVQKACVHISNPDLTKCSGNELSGEVHVDSGIGSMEWSNERNKEDSMKSSSYSNSSTSVTPLMHFNKLNLNDRSTTWSGKKMHDYHGKYANSLSRYAAARPHTWLNRSRSASPILTPKSTAPRSRVTSIRYRSEISHLKRMQSDYCYGRGSVLSAYKDQLPSPLK